MCNGNSPLHCCFDRGRIFFTAFCCGAHGVVYSCELIVTEHFLRPTWLYIIALGKASVLNCTDHVGDFHGWGNAAHQHALILCREGNGNSWVEPRFSSFPLQNEKLQRNNARIAWGDSSVDLKKVLDSFLLKYNGHESIYKSKICHRFLMKVHINRTLLVQFAVHWTSTMIIECEMENYQFFFGFEVKNQEKSEFFKIECIKRGKCIET